MNALLTYLAVHGLAIALGVLTGAAIAIVWLAPALMRGQERQDGAYLDGYEAGVAETKAEANLRGFGVLGKRANQ